MSLAEPYKLQEKGYCGRSLKCDATYQPQLKMLLLLHLWKEYQSPIEAEDTNRFFISALVQKIS